MTDLGSDDDRVLEEEAEAVRNVRLARDRALTPSERIERLHAMCANATALAEAAQRDAP